MKARGSCLLEGSGQEDAVRVFGVVRERRTVCEAEGLVQPAGWLESREGARLEAEASLRAPAGLDDDVLQGCARHTLAQMCGGSSHGLDFTVGWSELFKGATPKQLALGPNSPESDLWLEESGEIEGMHTLRRRELVHVAKVFGEERANFGASEVIDSNLHDRSGSSVCPNATS